MTDIAIGIKEWILESQKTLNHWHRIYPHYLNCHLSDGLTDDIGIDCDFVPLDFLNRFKEMIVTQKKQATTRWMKGEPFQIELKANKWMMATTNRGRNPFAILYVFKVEQCRLEEIGDDIAKIENMKSGSELIAVLKDIYPDIADDDKVDIVHFTCCHQVNSSFSG